MKLYTIIGGVNGTGKSSLTGVLRAERNDLGIIIDVDKLNASLGGKMAGGKAAAKKISDCIEMGISFTQETTLSGKRTLKTARLAKERGYMIRLYYVALDSLQESLARIQNRAARGGHSIPAADVTRRFATRFDDVARILPYTDEAVFYSNENGFQAVAKYKNGELFLLQDSPPDWAKKLQEFLQFH